MKSAIIDNLDIIAQVIGYLATIGGACWAVWRFADRVLTRFFNDRPLARLAQRVERLAAKIHLIINLHGDAIYVCEPDGSNVWVSYALAELFGLSPAQMLGNGWASAIDHTERQQAVQRWIESVSSGTPYQDEYTILVRGGRRRVRTQAFRHVNEDGDVVLYVGYVTPLDSAPG